MVDFSNKHFDGFDIQEVTDIETGEKTQRYVVFFRGDSERYSPDVLNARLNELKPESAEAIHLNQIMKILQNVEKKRPASVQRSEVKRNYTFLSDGALPQARP